MRRVVRISVILLVVLVLGFVFLLGIEIVLARRGAQVDQPAGVDACVGCDAGGPAPQRIAFLGDSTLAGVGASGPDGTVPRQVARRLGRPIQILDLAVSGDRVHDVLRLQLDRRLADFRPDVVVISVGANDAIHLTRRPSFRSDYRSVIGRLPAGTKVVLLGVPDMGSPRRLAQPLRAIAGFRGRQLDTDVRHLAKDVAAAYVDIDSLGPQFRRDQSLFASDRYHPSDRGYALWSELVARAIPG